MKVVINRCFGGWGLSTEACIWLVENRPECPYLNKSPLSEWGVLDDAPKLKAIPGTMWSTVDTFEHVITQDGEIIWSEDFQWSHPDEDDPPEKRCAGRCWSGRSSQDLFDCIQALGERACTEQDSEVDCMDAADVTMLGLKRASSRFAELGIVEVPDDAVWEIDEYDGIESIHEQHRSWR